jgi:hypothetical protein
MRLRPASAVSLAVAVIVAVLGLTACSPLGTSSGADALTHLTTAVDDSVAKFDNEGGTETVTYGDYHNLLIFDPAAPAGERVATAKLTDNSLPLFTSEEAISIHALASILQNPLVGGAEFSEKGNRFRIVGDKFVIEVVVDNGLVTQSAVVGAAFGTDVPQSVVTTYGLSDDVKKLFATSTHPSSTPTPTP